MTPRKIRKRNGTVVDFDPVRIEKAVAAALRSEGATEEQAPTIAAAVSSALGEAMRDTVPAVEDVQDTVEKELMDRGLHDVARSYILYRRQHAALRSDRAVTVDVGRTVQEYLDRLDWRVQANSNQGYSLGGLILNTAGKVVANYWLSHVYPQAVGDAHRNADLHIHDLDMLSGYCAGWSLRTLLETGFNGVPGKAESGPPKNLTSAVSQMVNFLGTLQNEWAGAQAFSGFDTYLAPFVRKCADECRADLRRIHPRISARRLEEEVTAQTEHYVHQNMQSFVFNLNVPSRWGTQTPFTNITLDWTCPEDLQDDHLRLGGETFALPFGQLQEEMDIINRAYLKVMMEGDCRGRVFTFPIPTYNITDDFVWDSPNADLLFSMTAKYGLPYFQNFLNSDLHPGQVRSMCCRLQLDLTELLKRGNGLFGSAEMTGSIGVVTINAARIGFTCRGDRDAFLRRIAQLMELAKASLELKRTCVQRWMDEGLFPYTRHYLGSLRNHFSTIGINGLNEAIRNFTDDAYDITDPRGQQFAADVLDFMRDRLKAYQEETGNLYNLEATPAEGATHRFAREDLQRYNGIITAGTPEAPYYTNSSQLPVEATDDPFEALLLQDDLQTRYTGGTVLHLYLGERISDHETCKRLVRTVLSNFHLPYITITPTFSICPHHGYLAGEHDFCPRCDEEHGFKGSDRDEALRAPFVSTSSSPPSPVLV